MGTCQTQGKSFIKVPAAILRFMCVYLDDTVSANLRKALREASFKAPNEVGTWVSSRKSEPRGWNKAQFSLPSAIPGCLSHSADKQLAKKGNKSSASLCSQALLTSEIPDDSNCSLSLHLPGEMPHLIDELIKPASSWC